VTIALHEVRMEVYGVLLNGLFTLNWMMHCQIKWIDWSMDERVW